MYAGKKVLINLPLYTINVLKLEKNSNQIKTSSQKKVPVYRSEKQGKSKRGMKVYFCQTLTSLETILKLTIAG